MSLCLPLGAAQRRIILHDSSSTFHRALDAGGIKAGSFATQASGVEIGHAAAYTASRSQAGGHEALHGLMLLAAAGGKVIAIAPSILRHALHCAQHVLQLGEVARHDCVADGRQHAGGAFAVLGQLLSGASFAAGAGFADQRIGGSGLVRKVMAGNLGWIGDHDKIPV